MTAYQAILQEMIDAAPEMSEGYASSLDAIEEQIELLQLKQDAMQNDIGNVAATLLQTYLTQTKFTPSEDYYFKIGETFNQILTESGTLTDWTIFRILDLDYVNYISETMFSCSGDQSSSIPTGSSVALVLGEIVVESNVISSSYSEGETTVEVEDPVITESLSLVGGDPYSYIPGDDTLIDKYVNDWNYVHDFIVRPLGQEGTYGTQDSIAKLNIGKNLIIANKNKVDNIVAVFEDYITS
jgi:hypothetical protein